MWSASPLEPYPTTLQYTLAPLATACSSLSSTRIPAPSPITNPSLPTSKGLEAAAGLSLYLVERALALLNPIIDRGLIQASTPPATITSQTPCCNNLIASPILWPPVAHAVLQL